VVTKVRVSVVSRTLDAAENNKCGKCKSTVKEIYSQTIQAVGTSVQSVPQLMGCCAGMVCTKCVHALNGSSLVHSATEANTFIHGRKARDLKVASCLLCTQQILIDRDTGGE
jgi:hypothetical protein